MFRKHESKSVFLLSKILVDCTILFYYLTIDAGTSGGKAAIINGETGKIISYSKKTWDYTIPEDLDPYGAIFNPNEFWEIILLLCKKVRGTSTSREAEVRWIPRKFKITVGKVA